MLTSNTVLAPASYNGVIFHVEVDSKASGRRVVPHEYPKRNIPYAEDMGRQIRRWTVNGYIIYSPVICPDWQQVRDDLIAELEADGNGVLVLPTGLQNMSDEPPGAVQPGPYLVTEHREKGGYCEIEMMFFEAGQNTPTGAADTQGEVNDAADNTATSLTSSIDFGGQGYGGGDTRTTPITASALPTTATITPAAGDTAYSP